MSSRNLPHVLDRVTRPKGSASLCSHWAEMAIAITNVDPLAECYVRWWRVSNEERQGHWAILGDALVAPALASALREAGRFLADSPAARKRFGARVLGVSDPLGRWLCALRTRGDSVAERWPAGSHSELYDSHVIWDVADRSAALCIELVLEDPAIEAGYSGDQVHFTRYEPIAAEEWPPYTGLEGVTH